MVDVYEMVTERILEELKKGIIPWHKPWVGMGGAISYATGKPYSLLNQMLLGKSGEWLTFKQVTEAGGKVKKGEKSRIVVFWKFIEKKIDETDENSAVERIPYLRYFNVFHISQTEGVAPKHTKPVSNFEPDKKAGNIFDEYTTREGIKVVHDEMESYYLPKKDLINLPEMKYFHNESGYFSTAFHEAVHSTGAANRLNRDGITKVSFFASDDYSKEELVAELGASMLMSITGLETDNSIRNNASYIQSWISRLENDKRFIVSAAGKAEKAVKYILNEKDEEATA